MTTPILLKNALIVNEGKITAGDVLLKGSVIEKIAMEISPPAYNHEVVDCTGLHLFPGVIDDQVHFREPGLTHKADIFSESRAAVAGGVTSFMEMPNTVPNAVTLERLEEKYSIASRTSAANYSFFMGGTNDNLDELRRTSLEDICGIKLFMGSSTGNMLVDNPDTLERIFSECPNLVAIHSEKESIIRHNLEAYQEQYGDDIPMFAHPEIRSVEACYESTKAAVGLAKKHNTRLHVLHISTAEELEFFSNNISLKDKKLTAEVCVHHLWFSSDDYAALGGLIKCNPAIKAPCHKPALFEALLDDRLDIIATDHAPHTFEEKQAKYMNCPSGLPLVQHPLRMMLDFHKQGKISLERIAEKMSHAVAECFRLKERGYIREGYKADLVLVDLNAPQTVRKENIFYKCGWSPLEGHVFSSSVITTFVNGNRVYDNGYLIVDKSGERLKFGNI